jgi:tetratricopeptide (TPR) repeat protein
MPFLKRASNNNKDLLLSVSIADTCIDSDDSSTDGPLSIFTMIDDDSVQVGSDDDLNSSFHEEEQKLGTSLTVITIEVTRPDQNEQASDATSLEPPEETTPTIGDLADIPAFNNFSAPAQILPFVDSPSPQSVNTLEVILEGEALEETRAKQLSPIPPSFPQLKFEPELVAPTASLSPPRSLLPPRPPKKIVAVEESWPEKVTRRPRSKSDPPLRENEVGANHNRRRKIPDSVSTNVMMNQDVLLDALAGTGDIDGLWMEYNVRRSHLGEKNPRAGQVLLVLGKHEVSQGNYATAGSLFQEASDCTEGDHKCVEAGFIAADACFNMGRLALEMQDPASAEDYIAKAMCMHQDNEVSHGRDPNAAFIVARCLHTLGSLRTTNGNLKSAMYTLQRAAAICEGLAIPQPIEQARVLDSIAVIYFQEGKLEKALTYQKDALQIKARAVGERHLSLVPNYKRLGHIYTESGKYISATNVYIRAEALLRKEYKRHQRRQDKERIAQSACRLGEMHELLASATTMREGASGASPNFLNFISRARSYYELGGQFEKVAVLQSLIDKASNAK